ncbi:hypothetical protein R1flu_001182 [Riccia fluitans]|uniref:GST N-terminal domain-containing protein n=1 Tax=Riccia fluitans TaxID=41844 RepID=A0ABD1Y5I0_9MARC
MNVNLLSHSSSRGRRRSVTRGVIFFPAFCLRHSIGSTSSSLCRLEFAAKTFPDLKFKRRRSRTGVYTLQKQELLAVMDMARLGTRCTLGSTSLMGNSVRPQHQRLSSRSYGIPSKEKRSLCARAEIKDAEKVETGAESSSTGESTGAQVKKLNEPRRFFVRSDQWLNILGGSIALPLRLGTGAFVQGYSVSLAPASEIPADQYSFVEVAGRKLVEKGKPGPRPEKPIELYEFEGCPFCRKVREIVSVLDIDVLFYPTPKNGPNFRPKAIEMGGKKQFPYMVDPNTGVSMYESDDIIKYLTEKYGDGSIPLPLTLGALTTITAGLAMLGRAGKGGKYTPAKQPAMPLKLWAYEPSPFCKIVREKLVELELPHYYYSTARGSSKRDELFRKTGHFQVPYLEDPNTGTSMFESAEIVEYLQETYALP